MATPQPDAAAILGNYAEEIINYDTRMTEAHAPNIRFTHKYSKKPAHALYTAICDRLPEKIDEYQATRWPDYVGNSSDARSYNFAIDQMRTALAEFFGEEK